MTLNYQPPHCCGDAVLYLVDGLSLGSAAFVESVFEKNRTRMGVQRTSGARVPKVHLGGLRTLRDLWGSGTGFAGKPRT